MKNISLTKSKFQSLLNSIHFIFNLLFNLEPETDAAKPYVFVCPGAERRRLVKQAAAAFELKKQGRAQ